MGLLKDFIRKWELRSLQRDMSVGIRDYYQTLGEKYCSVCQYAIPLEEDRYTVKLFEDENNILHYKGMEGYESVHFNVCFRCAENGEQLKRIVFNRIKSSKHRIKHNKEENQMSIKEVLNNEKVKLEKQLNEFNAVNLPDNLPVHIKEHLNLKKTLIFNCIKSIEELENNYALDETIKKLFST